MCQAVSDMLSIICTVPIIIYTFREFAQEKAALEAAKAQAA
jgi:hypothetical protein